MKALSVTQPFASLLVSGAKRYETRHWRTNHRGWIAIHASKAFPREYRDLCGQALFCGALRYSGWPLPLGAIVGVAKLVDVESTDTIIHHDDYPRHWYHATILSRDERAFGDWSPGRWAWRLDQPHALKEPIAARGTLGLWEWTPPPELVAWLRERGAEV